MNTETGNRAASTTEYNGWANYQTWNLALWIANDEPVYNAAVEVARQRNRPWTIGAARQFCAWVYPDGTPDMPRRYPTHNPFARVRWPEIIGELNELTGA